MLESKDETPGLGWTMDETPGLGWTMDEMPGLGWTVDGEEKQPDTFAEWTRNAGWKCENVESAFGVGLGVEWSGVLMILLGII